MDALSEGDKRSLGVWHSGRILRRLGRKKALSVSV
jgi:hypothetical protein